MQITGIDYKNIKLPVHPQALSGLMQLDDTTDLNFKELDKLIRVDQGISASILKMANSSFYARGNKITSLQNAISLLGFKMIRSMVVLLTTKSLFDAGKYEKFRLYVHKHSVVTAIIAKSLAVKTGQQQIQEEAFVGGLLHDIGKVIMNLHDRQKFIETLNLSLDKKISFLKSENEIFGFDHTEVGKQATEAWNLPAIFVTIASGHEAFTSAICNEEDRQLLHIVSYANHIAKKIGYGLYLPEDDADSTALESVLALSDEVKKYYSEQMKEQIEADPFYKFCVGMMG